MTPEPEVVEAPPTTTTLPVTGSETVPATVLGLGAIGAGVGLMFAARRKAAA